MRKPAKYADLGGRLSFGRSANGRSGVSKGLPTPFEQSTDSKAPPGLAETVREPQDAVEKLPRETALEQFFSAIEVSFRNCPSVRRLLLRGLGGEIFKNRTILFRFCALAASRNCSATNCLRRSFSRVSRSAVSVLKTAPPPCCARVGNGRMRRCLPAPAHGPAQLRTS